MIRRALLLTLALLTLALGASIAHAEVIQRGHLRINFDGTLTPHTLPRHGSAPVKVAVDAKISSTNGAPVPQLRRISIAINRNGHFNTRGLALCALRDIQPSTTANALAACGGALVGEGTFSADVKLPEQSPFPSQGKILAFNGLLNGKTAIFAHIYGTEPVPTSYVLPFLVKSSKGTFGTVLEASFPAATGDWGFVTGISMHLDRTFTSHGQKRGYISAGCPAPSGFAKPVLFPLVKTSFGFAKGMWMTDTLMRTCRAGGG